MWWWQHLTYLAAHQQGMGASHPATHRWWAGPAGQSSCVLATVRLVASSSRPCRWRHSCLKPQPDTEQIA